MILTGTAGEKYPKFRDYLYYRFPKVIQSSKIVEAMLSHGSIYEDELRTVLHPGSHPAIDVEEAAAEPGTYYSCELGVIKGEKISLYTPLVAPFNDGPWYKENFFKNAKGQDVPIIGAVLLHFLCHWGLRDSALFYSSDGDPGYKFEKEVYGRRARLQLTTAVS
jgi:hypothetical protein